MLKDITDENKFLLQVYAKILNNCTNKVAISFIVHRVYKVLSRKFKSRNPTDFPNTPYDVQVVYLIDYLREDKLAYAFLYASSLNAQNTPKKSSKQDKSWLKRLKEYIGLYIRRQ